MDISSDHADPTQITQSTQPSANAVQQQPMIGVGITGGNKEAGPVGRVSEYVAPHPAESAPVLPEEVKQAGVELTPQVSESDIPQEVQQAGVQPAKQHVPVIISNQPPAQQTQLPTPVNYEQAKQQASHGNPANSNTWRAWLYKRVLEKLGLQNVI